jgi:hypothetical protein
MKQLNSLEDRHTSTVQYLFLPKDPTQCGAYRPLCYEKGPDVMGPKKTTSLGLEPRTASAGN